uniref:Uncharacterized protein n=1 Tax=Mycena chlorophos TaxID=658473 RepID=A0ABQ0LP19_MYCCL|nr:predicted protein [Mycena chlorophos]
MNPKAIFLAVLLAHGRQAASFDLFDEINKFSATPVGQALHHAGADIGHFLENAGKDAQKILDQVGADIGVAAREVESKFLEIKGFFDEIGRGAEALERGILTNGTCTVSWDGTPHRKEDFFAGGVVEALERGFAAAVNELQILFPPPDRAPNHEQRQAAVTEAMTRVGKVLGSVLGEVGVEKEGAEKIWRTAIQPALTAVIVLIGDLVEQHPILFEAVLVMLLADPIASLSNQLLQAIIAVIGFGPLGPIKGTLAAWIQGAVFGPRVPKGSLFAELQRAGMVSAKL